MSDTLTKINKTKKNSMVLVFVLLALYFLEITNIKEINFWQRRWHPLNFLSYLEPFHRDYAFQLYLFQNNLRENNHLFYIPELLLYWFIFINVLYRILESKNIEMTETKIKTNKNPEIDLIHVSEMNLVQKSFARKNFNSNI